MNFFDLPTHLLRLGVQEFWIRNPGAAEFVMCLLKLVEFLLILESAHDRIVSYFVIVNVKVLEQN